MKVVLFRELVKKSKILQKEIVDEMVVKGGSDKDFYRKNSR